MDSISVEFEPRSPLLSAFMDLDIESDCSGFTESVFILCSFSVLLLDWFFRSDERSTSWRPSDWSAARPSPLMTGSSADQVLWWPVRMSSWFELFVGLCVQRFDLNFFEMYCYTRTTFQVDYFACSLFYVESFISRSPSLNFCAHEVEKPMLSDVAVRLSTFEHHPFCWSSLKCQSWL